MYMYMPGVTIQQYRSLGAEHVGKWVMGTENKTFRYLTIKEIVHTELRYVMKCVRHFTRNIHNLRVVRNAKL
jgi:hypothetical protein